VTRVASGGDTPWGLAVGQLDTSGADKVVVANFDSGSVSVFAPDGRGGLVDAGAAPVPGIGPAYPALWRTSASSSQDIVVTENGSAKIFYLNYLIGGIQPLTEQAVGSFPNQITVGDFDGNAREDLAVANYGSGSISLFSNTTGGTPASAAGTVTGVSEPVGLANADVNGDGDRDLIIGARDGIYVALGLPGVVFGMPTKVADSTGLNLDLALADFNQDGDPDVLAAADASPGVRVFFGGAGSSFGSAVNVFSNKANGVAAADLSGDGVPDVMAVDQIAQGVAVESRGDGTFASARGLVNDAVAGTNFHDLETTDLDGDGDLEVVVSDGRKPGHLLIVENTALPDSVVAPAALAFAGQPATTAGAVATVTVANPKGGRPLHVGNVSITDGDDFLVASDACSGATVPRGGSCSIGVRFAPGSAGDKTAALRILSDAAGSPQTVTLTGRGLDAPVGPQGPQGLQGLPGRDATRLVLALADSRLRATAGRRVTVRMALTAPAALTLDIVRGTKRVARVKGSATQAGPARLVWSGKVGRRKATAGRYTLRVRAVGRDGQTAAASLRATLTKPR
jgi:hypothetical protein